MKRESVCERAFITQFTVLRPQDQDSFVPSTVQAHSKKSAQSEEQALPL